MTTEAIRWFLFLSAFFCFNEGQAARKHFADLSYRQDRDYFFNFVSCKLAPCTMVTYSKAESENDLKGILDLQKKNLARGLTDDEIQRQGFVTVNHSYDQLKKMNDHQQHVIAKENDRVVAYILAMTKHSRNDIPILIPMFEVFDQIQFGNKRVSEFNYLVVGQVCVDKQYRGMGIFDKCYQFYKECYQSKYDFAITEIAVRNERSLNAHKRVGFEVIHSYRDPENTDWKVVVWNWNR